MSDFLQTVTEAFGRLITRGLLSIESSGYDAQAFGNAVVVLVGQNLRVRVVRDRGEVFAEAASRADPDNWFSLQRVIRAVGTSSSPPEGLLTPEQAAEIVDRHFADLDRAFGSKNVDQTTSTLKELERFAVERLIVGTTRAER